MDDLGRVARRARHAAELGRLRGAVRFAPAAVALVVVLGVLAPTPALSASLAGCAGLAVVALRWWRRSVGAGATEGFLVGAPVALAGVLARACMPSLGEWGCGLACILVGVVSALAGGIATARERRGGAAHASMVVIAAATSFAGCAGLGVGVALTAAAATGGTCAGAAMLARRARAA